MSIYDFIVKDNQGSMTSLEKYKQKVLLIVNTATKCGLYKADFCAYSAQN